MNKPEAINQPEPRTDIIDELSKFLDPESEYVFYDDEHGFCINTQDVLDHLCSMLSTRLEPKKGEWINVYDENTGHSTKGKCSTCGRISDRPVGYYCKWCGAAQV